MCKKILPPECNVINISWTSICCMPESLFTHISHKLPKLIQYCRDLFGLQGFCCIIWSVWKHFAHRDLGLGRSSWRKGCSDSEGNLHSTALWGAMCCSWWLMMMTFCCFALRLILFQDKFTALKDARCIKDYSVHTQWRHPIIIDMQYLFSAYDVQILPAKINQMVVHHTN